MSEQDDLLDIRQAADFLHVSETSLRRWTNSGQLKCLRVGQRRERRFRRSDLLSFMESAPEPADHHDEKNDRRLGGSLPIDGLDVPFGSHLCAFYHNDEGRDALGSAFLDGLKTGTASFVCAAPAAHRSMLARLGQDVTGAAVNDGRLVVCEYSAGVAEQLAYWERQLHEAERRGAHAVRVLSDVAGFTGAHRAGRLNDYEAEYERHIARRFPVVTLCLYDVRVFGSAEMLDALKCHHDSFRYPPRRWLD